MNNSCLNKGAWADGGGDQVTEVPVEAMEPGSLGAGRADRPRRQLAWTLGLSGAVWGLLIIAVLLHRCEAQPGPRLTTLWQRGPHEIDGSDVFAESATQLQQLCCCTGKTPRACGWGRLHLQ